MTIEEIIERILEAAEIERRLPMQGMGGGSSSGWVPYTHSIADMNGWGEKRYQEERQEFWKRVKSQVTAPEVSRWEECRRWIIELVRRPEDRKALTAWAASKHGGMAFVKFCRSQGIHVETGRRRKNHALQEIAGSFGRNMVQHSNPDPSAVLMDDHEIIYFNDTFEADAFTEQSPLRYSWRDDPSMKPLFPKARVKGKRERKTA